MAYALADKVISLPMHPYLKEEDIKYICGTLSRALDQ